MKKLLWIILFSIVTGFYTCTEPAQSLEKLNSIDTLPKKSSRSFGDTLKIVTVFLKDTKTFQNCYAAVRGKDTSAFTCYLSKSPETGTIGMKLNFSSKLSYQQQMKELDLILKVAKGDFVQLDSLRSISIGRLFSTGDLAIEITNQYIKENKRTPSSALNKDISVFLLSSKLASDFNSILKPYSVSVNKISTEKAFFADKKYLYSMSKIATDSSKVAEKVLDALTYIHVGLK